MNSFSSSSIKHLLWLWAFIIIFFIECSKFQTPPVYDESLKSSLSISTSLGDHTKVCLSNSCSTELFESACGKTRKKDFFLSAEGHFCKKGCSNRAPIWSDSMASPSIEWGPRPRAAYMIPADFFCSTVFVSSFI